MYIYMYFLLRNQAAYTPWHFLTLGMHAQDGYSSWVCLSHLWSVCSS